LNVFDDLVSGVARGASRGTRSGAQALGAQQYTFCNHFKRVFKQKFSLDQSMLKNAYFLGKTVKID